MVQRQQQACTGHPGSIPPPWTMAQTLTRRQVRPTHPPEQCTGLQRGLGLAAWPCSPHERHTVACSMCAEHGKRAQASALSEQPRILRGKRPGARWCRTWLLSWQELQRRWAANRFRGLLQANVLKPSRGAVECINHGNLHMGRKRGCTGVDAHKAPGAPAAHGAASHPRLLLPCFLPICRTQHLRRWTLLSVTISVGIPCVPAAPVLGR